MTLRSFSLPDGNIREVMKFTIAIKVLHCASSPHREGSLRYYRVQRWAGVSPRPLLALGGPGHIQYVKQYFYILMLLPCIKNYKWND